ncbi:hypothetical protein P6U16_24940 (plasmid) [Rhizobium sp. 32-5/1]|uniref:hypothetical protein n=1 Tax=Rhizobium sp. 32-5/1 TaxID=3019602 RepID=UPI00240D4EAA|nr:hypothetical protein [Rhizobium sp. 32-5/1]WEZ85377.1 hypothetical protein P6U16_24940 [Rhizobium sp. 32-5/1]
MRAHRAILPEPREQLPESSLYNLVFLLSVFSDETGAAKWLTVPSQISPAPSETTAMSVKPSMARRNAGNCGDREEKQPRATGPRPQHNAAAHRNSLQLQQSTDCQQLPNHHRMASLAVAIRVCKEGIETLPFA